ncbi:MAG: hypothetical protein ACLR8Y_02380 [Alistipes indistinctus]
MRPDIDHQAYRLGSVPCRGRPHDHYRAYKMTYIAVPLMVAGIAVNSERNHFCDLRNSYMPTFRHDFDDYLQYAPVALMFG